MFHRRLNIIEEKYSEFQDREIDTTQNEAQKGKKRLKKWTELQWPMRLYQII